MTAVGPAGSLAMAKSRRKGKGNDIMAGKEECLPVCGGARVKKTTRRGGG